MKVLRSLLLLFSCLAALWPATAGAHAEPTRSDPLPNATLAQMPARVQVWFSEPLNPSLSKLEVRDASGKPLPNVRSSVAADDPKRMEATLPAGTGGQGLYTVAWTSLSAVDGHVLRGTFLFAVGVELGENQVAQTSIASALSTSRYGPIAVIFIWLDFLGLLTWVGTALLSLFVLHLGKPLPAEQDLARALLAPTRRLITGSILLMLVGLSGRLSLQALTLAESNPATVLSPAFWQALLFSSWPGWATVLRAALALGAFTAALTPWRNVQRALVMQVADSLGALTAVALTGHAAAVTYPLVAALTLAWAHDAAAAVWAGGLFCITLVLLPAARRQGEATLAHAMTTVLPRFSPWALASAFVLVVTGIFHAEVHLPALSALWTTIYGQSLLVKAALVGSMAIVASLHAFWLRSRTASVLPMRLVNTLIRAEAAFAALVVLAVGLLLTYPVARTTLSPQRAEESTQGITLAQAAQNVLVTLRVSPGMAGRNTFAIKLQDHAGETISQALVRLRLRPLTEDLGTTFVRTERQKDGTFLGSGSFTNTGPWSIEVVVRQEDQEEVSTTFHMQVPVSSALPLLALAESAMNSLTSVRQKDRLDTGLGHWIDSETISVAPDRILYVDSLLNEVRSIGAMQYIRQPGNRWLARIWPDSVRAPHFRFTENAEAVTLLGLEVLDGHEVFRVGYYDRASQAHFQVWIGTRDYLIRKLLMMQPGHYMESVFTEFNSPALRVDAPPSDQVVADTPALATAPAPVPTVGPVAEAARLPARPRGISPVSLALGIGVILLGVGVALLGMQQARGRRGTVITGYGLMTLAILGGGWIILLAFTAAQQPVASPAYAKMQSPFPSSSSVIARGQELYGQYCAVCHGESGRGDGPKAATLPVRPANLLDHISHHTDGELFGIITAGVEREGRTTMPPFADIMPEEDRWMLVHYLRALGTGRK